MYSIHREMENVDVAFFAHGCIGCTLPPPLGLASPEDMRAMPAYKSEPVATQQTKSCAEFQDIRRQLIEKRKALKVENKAYGKLVALCATVHKNSPLDDKISYKWSLCMARMCVLGDNDCFQNPRLWFLAGRGISYIDQQLSIKNCRM